MKTFKATGIVCSSIKLGEADKIVTVYSDLGIIRAVAKGVRKTKSKFGGRLEPLSFVSLVLYKGRNLDTITQADLIKPFLKIRSDLKLMSHAFVLTNLVEKIAEHESHRGELLEILVNSIKDINNGENSQFVLMKFKANVLSELGYFGDTGTCVKCGRNLESKSGVFGVESGGFLCSGCEFSDDWRIEINKNSSLLLDNILRDNPLPAENISHENLATVSKILDSYIKYHLDINLTSHRFLANLT